MKSYRWGPSVLFDLYEAHELLKEVFVSDFGGNDARSYDNLPDIPFSSMVTVLLSLEGYRTDPSFKEKVPKRVNN